MSIVFIGLGSNLGDKETNIKKAIDLLSQNPDIEIVKTSSLITTKAITPTPQPDFLNGVIKIKTSLSPQALLALTQNIEKKLGRKTKADLQPRPIDLDILLYDDLQINLPELKIPHPRMYERDFVLVPLKEIFSL